MNLQRMLATVFRSDTITTIFGLKTEYYMKATPLLEGDYIQVYTKGKTIKILES